MDIIDNYIENEYDGSLRDSLISQENGFWPNKKVQLNHSRSFMIKKDSDRIFDSYKNNKNTIEFKRYGQFVSLCDDIEPDKKQIIDIFDLYKLLRNRETVQNKPNQNVWKKMKNIWKK